MKDDRNAMGCKTTKFHITQISSALFSASGRTGCCNGMPGPDCVSVCRYFLFCFPLQLMIFAVSVCHPSPGPRWSPLSWQTFEVSQADTNIEHHPHIAQNFLVKRHDLIFFGPHYIWAIFYWAPSNFVFVVCCSCTGISQEGRGNDDDWDNFIINISSRPKNAHWHSRRHKRWKHVDKYI